PGAADAVGVLAARAVARPAAQPVPARGERGRRVEGHPCAAASASTTTTATYTANAGPAACSVGELARAV
ncbi:hypothetical protein KEM52_005355, partial [Ascosphaera acerosa]